jgi:hypothetical protein
MREKNSKAAKPNEKKISEPRSRLERICGHAVFCYGTMQKSSLRQAQNKVNYPAGLFQLE